MEKTDKRWTDALHKLKVYIHTIGNLSEESWLILQNTLTVCQFSKGDYILTPGEVCQSIFFITQGYCRAFYDKEGDEINTAFYFEQEFATNLKSLTKNLKSEYAIQACESLISVRFDRAKLLAAYQLSPEIESFGRKLLEMLVAQQEEQMALFQLLTAQERYEHLLRYQPQVVQRISLTQIASYLGIARETLSRIRSKVKNV
ncbi:Crp/Fnr family transcriptional regulator [Cytophagaceae bacterium DM2B3-1]|uniref:Crp/Fnr family transcriptional regulator n=1 Tax=Xanthocytophaga flava TaxID=3048013 RepID=A0ABT7CYV3_9BACT|nr:Crp/Fnr family transcriptional regulator [Xanthocytophaga flavus]MDJ1473631.1 Crp/Fnr family transcriptional regulator [Xanthocytophaga flavus]MDJ1498927.1 Crp/Fnr family transcriptional regulator [Xanthocytophaga flavus]